MDKVVVSQHYQGRLLFLDGLRGVAAIGVILQYLRCALNPAGGMDIMHRIAIVFSFDVIADAGELVHQQVPFVITI